MGLPGKDRRNICLLGPASASLKAAFSHRNLEPLESAPEDAIVRCRGAARAVVSISSPLELSKHLAGVLRPALENGVAFLAVDAEKNEFAQISQMCSSEELLRRLNIVPQDAKDASLLPVRAFATGPDWEQKIAQYCAEHDPGRSMETESNIDTSRLPGDNPPDEEDLLLARRAFNDCSLANLEYLGGGRSRAHGPWKVDAQLRDGRSPVKFVIKTGPIDEITKEVAVMQETCFNHIPFRHYPPVAVDRCVIGATKRAITCMLVEDATTFEEYIRSTPPETKVREIFDGPLRLWRKPQGIERVNLGKVYRERGGVPKEYFHLNKIWRATRQNNADVLKSDDMYRRFISQDEMEVEYALSHGDLHLRNILIHPSGDVLLIDFSDSDRLPASYDPATLDVALAFDIPEQFVADAGVSDEQRIELYRPPLLEARAMTDPSHRISAILALRDHIRDSVGEAEYKLAVAARLMQWALWKRSQIAYRCASRVLESLVPGAS